MNNDNTIKEEIRQCLERIRMSARTVETLCQTGNRDFAARIALRDQKDINKLLLLIRQHAELTQQKRDTRVLELLKFEE